MKKPKPKPKQSVTPTKTSELSKQSEESDFGDLRQDLEVALSGIVQKTKVGEATDMVLEIVQQEMFSGPLPHPRHLKAYEDICEGTADRLLTMTEKTVDANNAIPELVITKEAKYSTLGLILGFIVMLVLIIGAITCAILGKPAATVALLGVACMGAVAKFVDGRVGKNPVNPPSA